MGSAIRLHYGRMDQYLDNQKNYRTLVKPPLVTVRLNSVEAGKRVYRVGKRQNIPHSTALKQAQRLSALL